MKAEAGGANHHSQSCQITGQNGTHQTLGSILVSYFHPIPTSARLSPAEQHKQQPASQLVSQETR